MKMIRQRSENRGILRFPISGMLVGFVLSLVGLIYGVHLFDGYFADDYLYLSWLDEGLGKLLRVVSIESFYPKMIRPIPVLTWTLSRFPHGDVLLHGVSFLLHALTAALIGIIIRRRSNNGSLGAALSAAALFAVFPLFGEPVIWISGHFDLWSAAFALASIAVLTCRDSFRAAPVIAAGLYFLGLLSKESVIILPLLLPFLFPWEKIRKPFFIYGGIAAGYLLFRFALFHGIGGYQTTEGHLILLAASPFDAVRVLVLQIPYRILQPMKYAGVLGPWILGLSASLWLGIALSFGLGRFIRAAAIGLGAVLISLLPVFSMIRVEYDHLGSRLIYFPIAVGMLVIGSRVKGISRAGGVLLSAWIVLWSAIAMANNSCWIQAKRERDAALSAMTRMAERFPTGSTVFVDVHDTLGGAYVFNNGLNEAARYHGVPTGIRWEKGTCARLGAEAVQRPGKDVFEIGFSEAGGAMDTTSCAGELMRSGALLAQRWNMSFGQDGFQWRGPSEAIVGVVGPMESAAYPAGDLGAQLILAPIGPEAIQGTFFWRTDPAIPFTGTDARSFRISPGTSPALTFRLRLLPRPATRFQWRIDFDRPIPADRIRTVSVGPIHDICK